MEHSTASSRFPLILFQNLAAARDLRSFEQGALELQGWMQEKTTLLEEEFRVHCLSPAQPLLQQQQQQHRRLQVKALPDGSCLVQPHSFRHPAEDLCPSVPHQR